MSMASSALFYHDMLNSMYRQYLIWVRADVARRPYDGSSGVGQRRSPLGLIGELRGHECVYRDEGELSARRRPSSQVSVSLLTIVLSCATMQSLLDLEHFVNVHGMYSISVRISHAKPRSS